MALFINPELCELELEVRLCLLNHSYVSQILWNGFSAHVKGDGWCLSAPVIWKIQFKRMRERMVHGLFSFPHTGRYENDVLLCAGNDANRTAEKFLHNSIQFLLNPNGECLCQEEAEMTETKREGSRLWWRKRGWRLSVKQWRNGERAAGSLKGTERGGSGSLERSGGGRNKKNVLEMINSDRSGILRKAYSFPLIASLQHLTQHLQRNSLGFFLAFRPVQ